MPERDRCGGRQHVRQQDVGQHRRGDPRQPRRFVVPELQAGSLSRSGRLEYVGAVPRGWPGRRTGDRHCGQHPRRPKATGRHCRTGAERRDHWRCKSPAVGMLAKASQAMGCGAPGLPTSWPAAPAPPRASRQIAGVVGFIIGELVNYGLLIAQIAINRLTRGRPACQPSGQPRPSPRRCVPAMMFALATTGVGAIVVAIIG